MKAIKEINIICPNCKSNLWEVHEQIKKLNEYRIYAGCKKCKKVYDGDIRGLIEQKELTYGVS